jgi:formamidopyrimidine-DNA glycosylase
VPELPDIVVYIEKLRPLIEGRRLDSVRIASPFLLRTVEPPVSKVEGRMVLGLRRLGKRVVISFEERLFLVFHLMIAGRFHWTDREAGRPRRPALATLDFTTGTLTLTEAGTKKRASLHVIEGEEALKAHDLRGLEVLEAGLPDFRAAITREKHTLKRALTDPRLFSGIGNAYSDEILHRARLSPLKLTHKLSEAEIRRLFESSRLTLLEWVERLRREAEEGFPERVTAFRHGMAVHGRFGKPCPACGTGVQRIVYAENETNYCPRCQTEGRLLADRSLSRLLKEDWPRSISELEEIKNSPH